MIDESVIVSVPIPIRWAGWQSDTFRLQQAGWKLSAKEGPQLSRPSNELSLAIHHPVLRCYGLSKPIDVDYFGMIDARHRMSVTQMVQSVGFDIHVFASDLQVQIFDEGGISDFRPIDAAPAIKQFKASIDELNIFAPAQLVRTEEVLVMPDSVPELMARILELQDPKQAEIRERVRKRAARQGLPSDLARPVQKFHAQILSVE